MKKFITFLIGIVLLYFVGSFIWNWGFCRFYVEPGNIAVITAKEGTPLGDGEILAKEGQKGVQERTLGPGRHFLNPYKYTWEIKPLKVVPPGKVGIVTAKVGENLPPGEFLANPGQKGIWKDPLGPGTYALNPYGYDIDFIDAISIPIGYIGVVTSLSGKASPENGFAQPGEKGVMENILQPGLYYINPKAYKVDLIEIGVNQISLSGQGAGAVVTKNTIITGNQAMQELQNKSIATQQAKRSDYLDQSKDMAQAAKAPAAGGKKAEKAIENSTPEFTLNQHLEFPSRDGFKIQLDMTVEFELLPEKIAGIYRDYGDMPAVVEKILMPQILSVSRLKGSAYKATDFIAGEGREKFQADLTDELHETLGVKSIKIHDALIRSVDVPETILDPLQQASIAREQDLTNKEMQETEKKQGELNTETQLIAQKGQEVTQETAKMKAEIEAEKNKAVAEIEAEMSRQIAAIDRETAQVLAERDIILGKAKANAIKLVEGEKARGFELKVKALGTPNAYTLSEFANALNPNMKIKIMHSGPGTLWTDGSFTKGEAALIQKSNQE